ncbi:Oxidation resistance protein 1, partial [Gryllus bimaculatus]
MEYDFPIVVDEYDRPRDVRIWETELHDFVVWYIVPGDSDGGGKDGLAERRPVPKAPPVNTTTYTVSAHDTLTSVAARFDTTPSELAEINRLATRLVFPGQVLQVPLKDGTGTGASAVAAAAVTPCRGAWTPADPTAAAAAAPAA